MPQSPARTRSTLNVTVVYHDARTQAWARDVYGKMSRLAGSTPVRATWWKISDLVEPGVLAGAVSTAMRADVVMVAIDASEGLPFPFNVWVDNWLPHRMHTSGRLVALLGRPAQANGCLTRARDYLRAVAQVGGFEFLLEERPLPIQQASPAHRSNRYSRPDLEPVEVGSFASIGGGVVHRAA